tara:strand:+ start:3959 stop:4693 length:735 start_codon:yes stop_codon:yes gene_type:complete
MKIIIIGATSAIARSTARLYAEQNSQIFLVGRDGRRLRELKADLELRGANSIENLTLDITNCNEHANVINKSIQFLGHIDIAIICHGSLPDQKKCESNFREIEKAININGLTTISFCTEISKQLELQKAGTLAVITSVAGDRGRQPNFIYGAAKSMVSTYLQGLRGKLLPFDVHVIDIKPGLVDSPMTAKFEKGALWSTPELVAIDIVSGIKKKRHTIYTPSYWRFIMAAVCSIPEVIFKKIKI